MMATTKTIPKLLNEALVREALLNYYQKTNKATNNNLVVKAFNFELSSANGENFCSDIFVADVKCNLNGNDMENSFIVKIMIPEVAEIGTNEEQMFRTVLPGMEDCLLAGSENKLHARCLVTERTGDHEFYVLENLNTLGYFCADRIKGLDEAHGRLLMQKLGKFHAASMMYERKFPEVVRNLGKSHFANGASDVIAQAITFGGLEFVAGMIEKWPGYEHLAPKLRNLIPRFNDLIKEVVDPGSTIFSVITHGDLWVNNILYKYDVETKQPIDVVFVDFQNACWGGCGYDINYFLYTSLELNVLKEKRQDLLKAYCEALRTSLEANKYPDENIPTCEDVLNEVKRSELVSLYTGLCELPIIALDRSASKHFTVDTFGQAEKMKEMRILMYANERVKESLVYTLKYFEEVNIL